MRIKTIAQLLSVLLLIALPLGWLVACQAQHATDQANSRPHWNESRQFTSPPTPDDSTGTPELQPGETVWQHSPAAQQGQQMQQHMQQQQQLVEPNTPPHFARADTFTVQPGEEIWIIAKPTTQVADNVERMPGCGALIAVAPVHEERQQPVYTPLPLKHTDVKASVAGYIATVDVTQQFHNPYASKIEAVYQFPLPHDAAVSEFVMEVGPPHARRRIRGVIRDKEQAQRIYEHAKRQGHNAALLEQVRPNIFEQKVANIEPGKQIDIQVRYFNTLDYHDGWYEFVFPMTIGPRYNPPYSKDPIHPVAHQGRGGWQVAGHPQAGKGTTISYLRPNERSGHDIAVSLDIDAGVSIEQAKCITHTVTARKHGEDNNRLSVQLSPKDTIPNKDFVFRFRVAGKELKTGLVKHVDAQGRGYFSLMMIPPVDLMHLQRQPMEMIFVVDCSGSMKGAPMRQCKEAMHHALNQLGPHDTFQIIRFSENASALGRRPLSVTPGNFRKARQYINDLSGTGGTEMLEGIKAALDMPQDRHRYRVVTFMTDGKIGNEEQVLKEMNRRMREARVFSFGVGSSVNRYLLEEMAKAGRGTAAYLLPNDSGKEVMQLYFDRVSRPALSDLSIRYGGATVAQVYPSTLPDVFVGRPVIVTGRYSGDLRTIDIQGRAGGQQLSMKLDGRESAAHPSLSQVWARRKIEDLSDRFRTQGIGGLEHEIRGTALEYGLVSAYTSYIAVDASRFTSGYRTTTVQQPNELPEDVDFRTTVND